MLNFFPLLLFSPVLFHLVKDSSIPTTLYAVLQKSLRFCVCATSAENFFLFGCANKTKAFSLCTCFSFQGCGFVLKELIVVMHELKLREIEFFNKQLVKSLIEGIKHLSLSYCT